MSYAILLVLYVRKLYQFKKMCEHDDALSARGFDSPTNARLAGSPNREDEQDMTREMMEEINAADGNEPNLRINE